MVDFSKPELRLHVAALQHLESALHQRHGLRQIERGGPLTAVAFLRLLLFAARRALFAGRSRRLLRPMLASRVAAALQRWPAARLSDRSAAIRS